MNRPIRKIAVVEPRQPLPSIIPKELIVLPRYGVPLIATILRNQGYDVTLFIEEIEPINWEIMYAADVVAFHTLTCTLGEMERIVKQLRLAEKRQQPTTETRAGCPRHECESND